MTPVSFVSLGPGGLDSVTVGAVKTLAESTRVVCAGSRCKAIVSEVPGVDAAGVEVWDIPMTSEASSAYERLADHVADLYSRGERVAVTVEGDMSLYSSMHYVMDLLADSGIEVRAVAGVPALAAASAVAGLHLVKHDERLTVIPGNATAMELNDLIEEGSAIVVMKASRCRESFMELLAHRPCLEFYYLESVGTPQEYVTSQAEDIYERRFPYFSIILIPAQA